MLTIIAVGCFAAIVVLVAVVFLSLRRLFKTAENIARVIRPGGLLGVFFGSEGSEPGKEEDGDD